MNERTQEGVSGHDVVAEIIALRTEMNEQRSNLTRQLEESRNENHTLRTRLDQLNPSDRMTDETPTTDPTPVQHSQPTRLTEPAQSPLQPVREGVFPRARYPDVEPFNGEDPRDYRAFRINLYTKFLVDSHCFRSDEERILYTFGRLKGKASRRMLPWISAKQQSEKAPTLDEFYQALDQAFSDVELQRKALVRINTMKQGKRDFEDFLTEFDSALIDAGGLLWDDAQKKALLDTAVNRHLLEGTIGTDQPHTYEEYCKQLRRIGHQQQRIARLSQKASNSQAAQPGAKKDPAHDHHDVMDWESTSAQISALQAQVAALRTEGRQRGKRATWVSDAEIQKRRSDGKCVRCGSEKHFVRNCLMMPARRPGQVNAVQPSQVDKSEDDGDVDGSGKE